MKLGDTVTFDRRYVKAQEGFDYERAPKEVQEDLQEGGSVTHDKRSIQHFEHPRQGIIVGKRRIGIKSILTLEDRGYYEMYEFIPEGEGKMRSKRTITEAVYLVAENMSGLHYVPLDAVKLIEN